MLKPFLALLLCCILLCGCAAQDTRTEAESTLPVATETILSSNREFYKPSALESETHGALRSYPLDIPEVTGFLPMEEDILLFAGWENTTLLKLSGDNLQVSASAQTSTPLTPDAPSVQVTGNGISYFDSGAMETVILDTELHEIKRIDVPANIVGTPLLSLDQNTLYYCTISSVRALDTASGISRVLRNITSHRQAVAGLWLEDSVLELSVTDEKEKNTSLYLSAQTGAILHEAHTPISLTASNTHYYALISNGFLQNLLFGTPGETTFSLLPKNPEAPCTFLPYDHSAVVAEPTADSSGILHYYDLSSGRCTASLSLHSAGYPNSIASNQDGIVFFSCYDELEGYYVLYRWDTAKCSSGDQTSYITPYFSQSEPDQEGLQDCKAYAAQIGEKHGIRVLVYDDTLQVRPSDYKLEPEYLVPVIRRELKNLDARLEHYPSGFLQQLSSCFDGLTISLVRQLQGSPEAGSLDAATGIQYWDGYHAYIALAAGSEAEKALYHELCHLIDTVVFNESIAYDQWEELNPPGFAYDYDYIANQTRQCSEYLQDDSRAFIDTYSMSFPKEDRARIMEYAMTPGNENYFRSVTMQNKLLKLCEGIRKAFNLQKSSETFLWEQYLRTSLAYTE